MKINFSELREILKVVSVISKGEDPVVHFVNKDKKLYVEYSGQVAYYFHDLEYKGTLLSFSVDFQKFSKIAKGLSGEYDLSIKDDKQLIMKAPSNRYVVECFNVDKNELSEFNRYFEAWATVTPVSLQSERLITKISNISYCVADPKDFQTMSSVYIKDNLLVAANQKIGGVSKYENIKELDGNIINNAILTIIPLLDSDFLNFGYLEHAVMINSEKFGIMSSITNEYPIETVSPLIRKCFYNDSAEFAVVLPPSMSKAVLKKFLNFVGNESVSISIQDKFLIFSCFADNIHAEEKVPADIIKPFKGDVLVNPDIMYKALNSMDGDCYLFGYDDSCLYLSDGDTSVFFNRDVNEKGINK